MRRRSTALFLKFITDLCRSIESSKKARLFPLKARTRRKNPAPPKLLRRRDRTSRTTNFPSRISAIPRTGNSSILYYLGLTSSGIRR